MKSVQLVGYIDGASSGNPGRGGWGAVLIVKNQTEISIVESGGPADRATNNQMELRAAIELLRLPYDEFGELTIYTDSKYLMNGAEKWLSAWKKRDWKTTEGKDVLNRELWEELDQEIQRCQNQGRLIWKHVPGHAGIPGNERADEIASTYAQGQTPRLYSGGLDSYHTSVEALFHPKIEKKTSKKGKAYSYLSLVDGRPMRHQTWAECDKRVKGRSGAKYKKVMSREEEKTILQAWGFSLSDIE